MMLTPARVPDFTSAYVAVLRRLHADPLYRTSGRGKDAVEVPNISFQLTDPTRRMVLLAARRSNIAFNYAEALWYLLGSDDLDMISYYAPQLASLSTDGETLTGTAYGRRLFHPDLPDRRSQYDRVIDLLKRDRDSKRATMLLMRPDDLVDPGNPDVACTLGLQLMIRGDRLHMTAYMRGNDAVIGLLCDVFSFTIIQEFAARELGIPVGTYTHHVGSMHINVNDLDRVTAILAEADRGPAPDFAPNPMPATSWQDLTHVRHWEQQLRYDAGALTLADLHGVPVPRYWRQVLLLFEAYRQIRHTPGPVSADIAAVLDPAHRWLLAARWPDRITRPGVACTGRGPA